jgi:hypothetical protein
MPNWCDNKAVIRVPVDAPPAAREAFDRLVANENEEAWLSSVLPTPPEMHLGLGNTMANPALLDLDKLREISSFKGDFGDLVAVGEEPHARIEFKPSDEYRQHLMDTFGACDWYNWRLAKWGTKWDVEVHIEHADETTLSVMFNSAWSPPVAFFAHLGKLGLEWELSYVELGNGFGGTTAFEDGEMWKKEYRDDDLLMFAADEFGMDVESMTDCYNYESFEDYAKDRKHDERVMALVRAYFELKKEAADVDRV